MTYSLNLYDDAVNDLKSITPYLDNQFDKSVSDKILSNIFNQLDNLRNFSKAGKPIETITSEISLAGVYYLRTPKNTVLYEIDDKKSSINILRILDNRQDVTVRLTKYLVDYKSKK
jgi:plasmid stabilization system protein ParE